MKSTRIKNKTFLYKSNIIYYLTKKKGLKTKIMLWIIIGMIWGLIIFISLFGNYKEKELEKDYKKFEEICNNGK